jgi:predicted nucleotide-binding protein
LVQGIDNVTLIKISDLLVDYYDGIQEGTFDGIALSNMIESVTGEKPFPKTSFYSGERGTSMVRDYFKQVDGKEFLRILEKASDEKESFEEDLNSILRNTQYQMRDGKLDSKGTAKQQRNPNSPKRNTTRVEEFVNEITEPLSPINNTTQKYNVESDSVFIVHGHDKENKLELARFVENECGLNTIILHEKPNKGMAIVEKLEAYSNVGYVFVLLTPDDVGGPVPSSPVSIIPPNLEPLKPRARQNVVFELGLFMGKLGRERVCCVYKEGVELPSDYEGVLYLGFKHSVRECFLDIRRELKAAGFKLKP